MKKLLLIISVLFAASLAFNACEENPLPSENTTEVKGFTAITTNIPALYVGDSQEIKFKLEPSDANTALLNWVSLNENTATVKSGWVTGVAPGTTEIRAYLMSSVDKHVATIVDTLAKIPVTVKGVSATAAEIYISTTGPKLTSLNIFKNKVTDELHFGVKPLNATVKTATWTTSDKTKAVFQITKKDKDGKETKEEVETLTKASSAVVKALLPGTVTITATAEDGSGKSSSITLNIENVDEIDLWTTDVAGTMPIIGGDNPDIKAEGEHFISYSKGVASWPANTTGIPRSDTLVIPTSNSKIVVTQIEAKDFAGSWNFTAKTFAPNANLGVSAGNATVKALTIATKAGQTANDGSKNVTNNLTIAGMINTYVAEAVADIDYDNKTFRFGIFFDGAKAQAVNTGKSGYGYITLLPELGSGWGSYNFCPVPFNDGTNKGWLWFKTDSYNKFHYGRSDWQKCDGKDILGLAFCACKSATPAKSDYASTNAASGYDVIYQCNVNTKDDQPFFIERQ
jgi:hypothetical protein